MPVSRSDLRRQLEPGLNTVFGLAYNRYPEEWRYFMDVENESNRAYIEDVMMTGFGVAPVKGEGSAVQYDHASESYIARYYFETIALAFAITEEAEEDALYGDVGAQLAKALAVSMRHTKEVKNANILNNSTSASFPGGDGVALLSTAHPLKGGDTASNKLGTPADFSETSLEDLLIQMSQVTDDRGIPAMIMGQRLIIPTQLQFVAHRVLYSQLRVDSANNDPNAIRDMNLLPGGFKVVRRLTDPDAWYVKTDCEDGLKHVIRVAMKRGMEGDFETGNLRYKARERYIQGWSNWRGLFGSEGA
jgi:hypothetical protein